jgi:hypothetical protein
MEAAEAARVGRPRDPVELEREVVVGRRLVAGVDLELLRDRIDAVAEDVEQRPIGRFSGKDDAGEQDDREAGGLDRATLA